MFNGVRPVLDQIFEVEGERFTVRAILGNLVVGRRLGCTEVIRASDLVVVREILGGRRAGKTTRQILSAPVGAIFVSPTTEAMRHAEKIATRLGRNDLKMSNDPDPVRWANRQVVYDHSCGSGADLIIATSAPSTT